MRTTLARSDPPLAPPLIQRPRVAWSAGHLVATAALVLMAAASLGGLLIDGFYTDDTWARSAFRGNDLATLAVATPVFAAALALSLRGSLRGRLVTLGMLGYGTYNYAFYAFGARWSDWFLLHVAALACSLYGLVLLAATLDARRVSRALTPGVPRRAVAAYTALVGLGLAGLWTAFSLRYALTGELAAGSTPRDAMHLIFAIDLVLMAPALVVAGVLLWRRHPWGVPAAVAANVAGGIYQVALSASAQFQANAGVAGKTWFSPSVLLVLAGSAASVAVLLRHVRGTARP